MCSLGRLALFVLAPALAGQTAIESAALLAGATWRSRDVGVGVAWRQARVPLFGAPQQLSVLAVRNRDQEVRLRVAAPGQGLALTSDLARGAGACAAVNGGFFARDGGSARGLVVIGGAQLRPTGEHDPAALLVEGEVASLVDASDAGRRIAAQRDAGAETNGEDALAAGPWLLRGGAIRVRDGGPRHPRTAVGSDGRTTFFVTVDGRAEEAAGMTLHELAQVLLALGCRDAFNLDGGGSTTMWVRGLGGVVNCPCDDQRFDAAGERAVANAVLVLGRPTWTLDEEAAVLAPEEAFTAAAGAGCIDGDCVLARAQASATFDLAGVPLRHVTVEVGTRSGDEVVWSLAGRTGSFVARHDGWLVLDDFEWTEDGERKLVLRSSAPFRVDAVRVVQGAE